MQDEYPNTAEGICRMHHDAMRDFEQMSSDNILVCGLEAWLVENGAIAYEHTPRPDWLPRMTPNQCFKNAYELAMVADLSFGPLHYVEGNVVCTELPLLVEHAWCVTDDGTVVDPTLPEIRSEVETSYFGIQVPLEIVNKSLAEYGVYGVLDKPLARELVELERKLSEAVRDG